jgi:PmbA protein
VDRAINTGNLEDMAREIIREARAAGADETDVYLQIGRESEVTMRMRKIENLKESISQGLGIRIFKNKKLGFCFSSDFSLDSIRELVKKAAEISDMTSADEFNGLPEFANGHPLPELELYDDKINSIKADRKIELCHLMEQAMFDYDKRIQNSDGVSVYDGDSVVVIANSAGGSYSYKSSFCYLVCNPIASEGDKLQAGSWHTAKRFFDELDPPEKVARIAAERAVQMLGARQPQTVRVPVVFDIMTAASLISSILGALDGDTVYKGASFLGGKLGRKVASDLVTIIDDPHIVRGLGSSPFDGEGLPTRRKEVISAGELRTFLYDAYTARKAKASYTANARREYQSLPSIGPFNFYLENGKSSFGEIIKSVKNGLYLTSLMGFGANTVTGDYSLGGSGLWIENGEFAYPVEGITVAANMLDILTGIDMVGNDLAFMGPVASPTFRVAEMTVSGA